MWGNGLVGTAAASGAWCSVGCGRTGGSVAASVTSSVSSTDDSSSSDGTSSDGSSSDDSSDGSSSDDSTSDGTTSNCSSSDSCVADADGASLGCGLVSDEVDLGFGWSSGHWSGDVDLWCFLGPLDQNVDEGLLFVLSEGGNDGCGGGGW